MNYDSVFCGTSDTPSFSTRDMAAIREELSAELRDKEREKRRMKKKGKNRKKLKKLKQEVKCLRKALKKAKRVSKASTLKKRKSAQENFWHELAKRNTPLVLEILYRLADKAFFPPQESQITDPARLLTAGNEDSKS